MDADTNKRDVAHLSSLMKDALDTCRELYRYASDNFPVFNGDDGDKIMEVVNGRKKIVGDLAKLEREIDSLLQADGGCAEYADELPCGFEEFRITARSILDKVSELDREAMEQLKSKMQKYKEETLSLRKKKNLSAYIKTEALTCSDTQYDCKRMTLFD